MEVFVGYSTRLPRRLIGNIRCKDGDVCVHGLGDLEIHTVEDIR